MILLLYKDNISASPRGATTKGGKPRGEKKKEQRKCWKERDKSETQLFFQSNVVWLPRPPNAPFLPLGNPIL